MPNVLEGIRVVDFSRVFAGPAATQLLGDLGAEVIKVEEPGGDDARYFGVSEDRLKKFRGNSPSFLALNRNKKSVVLNLRVPAAREVARKLASTADVVVHNFRPGVMERWGMGYEQIGAINPGVVYAEFSAYGTEGPLAGMGANDVALQAHSGLMSMTGESNRPPVRTGTAVIDLYGGLATGAGILAALLHRERTGEGQKVETSLLQSSANLMSYFYTEYWLDGTQHKPMGTANHLTVPNQAFPAADGSVVIIAHTDDMWERCSRALDPEALDRPEFRTSFDRQINRVALVEALSAVTRRMPSFELVQRLGEVRVVAAKVNSTSEAADSSQLQATGGVFDLGIEGLNARAVSTPFRLSRTPGRVYSRPPALGSDTDAVLAEVGYSASELAGLRESGAFSSV